MEINEHTIPGGHILVARQVIGSGVWIKDPLTLKCFLWIAINSNYADREQKGYKYKRGELCTTYDAISKGLTYYHNRHRFIPTIKTIRIILGWLKAEGMIEVYPLERSSLLTGADSGAETRAYVGIKIVVVNYDTYQTPENYRGRDKGRDLSSQGHYNNKDKQKDIYIVHHGNEKCTIKEGVGEVLDLLNEEREKLAGRKLKPITTEKQLAARFKEGRTVYEACRVVTTKALHVTGGKLDLEYFHPSTLFGKDNFVKYLDQAELLRGAE